MEVFREHVKLSEMLRKPLIVHCVKAVDELLAIRKEMGVTHPWVLHGYRGGPEQAEQLRRAEHCTGCARCNSHCPQQIDIPKEIANIDAWIGEMKNALV